jgi:patatin-like phospholipase/acyl hydrolase
MAQASVPLRLLSLGKAVVSAFPQTNETADGIVLDGGGVRGLSSLYILRSIMRLLEAKAGDDVARPLLPCKYFDLIGGTSTGG